jgi:hypothetical protein
LNRGLSAWAPAPVAAVLATPAFAQTLGQASDVHLSYWRVAAALLLCLALAAGAALALRARLAAGGRLPKLTEVLGKPLGRRAATPGRPIALLDRLRIGPQLEVCLLRCEGRQYLIAVSPNGTSVIDKDLPPAEPEGGEQP